MTLHHLDVVARAMLGAVAVTACGDAANPVNEAAVEPALSAATSITWDSKAQMKQIVSTRGCDSWTPTWAPDGNLYTAYGDCRPKGAPQKLGMGFGLLSGPTGYDITFTPVPTGDPLNWDDTAVGAGVEALGDGPASEKPAGMLHADGLLWYWIRNISPNAGTGVRLKFSNNYSTASPDFTWSSWTIPEVGYASFVQYGQGYAGGPAYTYAVIPMRSTTTGNVSNSAYDLIPGFSLMRGSRPNLRWRSSWKFFCGTASVPAWCDRPGSAKSILNVADKKFAPRAGISWNPGLGKFMLTLVYDPTPATTNDSPRFTGGLMVLLSSNPWGPWETVFSSGTSWPGGSTAVCDPAGWGAGERADIPTKYLSADGKTFYLFSSGGDCLSIARGVLIQ